MDDMESKIGQLHVKYGARGSVSYSIEVSHHGLLKHRLIRGPAEEVVDAKVRLQAAEWDAQWAKKVATDARLNMTYRAKELAAARTAAAQEALHALRETLVSSLSDSMAVDFDTLKDRSPFPKQSPAQPNRPQAPAEAFIPAAPLAKSPRYQPELGLLDKVIRSRRAEKEAAKQALFEADVRAWEAQRDRLTAEYAAQMEAHHKQLATLETAHSEAMRAWEAERAAFKGKQAEQHKAIDGFRARYEAKVPEAITECCDLVLANSEYPDCLPKEFEFDFNGETGVLVVNYRLPAPADIPTLSEVKYVQSSDTFTEKHLSESNAAKLYDEIIYQIALRTLNELLEADQVSALASVVFNGFVTAVDKGTGNAVTACIISIQATKEALAAINLAKVEPKACFRQLKGVGSSKLHSVTPVPPIINMRREDECFVVAYAVADQLNEGFNLAAMDWEDFEHLIREIFEKEFTSSGGEVKVTQASRDGGVDAVAFDPDLTRSAAAKSSSKPNATRTLWASQLYATSTARSWTRALPKASS
jgi:restriction system protein